MKTKKFFTAISIMMAAFIMTSNAQSQRTSRYNQINNRQNNKRTETQYHSNKNENRKSYSENNHQQNQNNNRHNDDSFNNRNDHSWTYKNNNKHDSHGERYPQYNNKQGSYHHHNNHGNDRVVTYYKGLPTGRVHKFNHGGYDYYECNKHFYRYHPRFGYYVVDSPFVIVNYLPRNYYIKVVGGNRYIYSNGFYYMPFETGFMMIPERNSNYISFSFSFNR